MKTKQISWNTGNGNITLTYEGQGNGAISVSSDANNLGTIRSQTITVKTENGAIVKNLTVRQAACPVPVGTILNYPYSGSVKEVLLPAGRYKLQCWGAQGGAGDSYAGGKGGYSEGEITLTKPTTVYIFVGGKGSTSGNGGWNGGGGGSGSATYSSSGTEGSSKMGCGGGATDIALVTSSMSYSSNITNRSAASLLSRMIVAGGGGGGAFSTRKEETTYTIDLKTKGTRFDLRSLGTITNSAFLDTSGNIIKFEDAFYNVITITDLSKISSIEVTTNIPTIACMYMWKDTSGNIISYEAGKNQRVKAISTKPNNASTLLIGYITSSLYSLIGVSNSSYNTIANGQYIDKSGEIWSFEDYNYNLITITDLSEIDNIKVQTAVGPVGCMYMWKDTSGNVISYEMGNGSVKTVTSTKPNNAAILYITYTTTYGTPILEGYKEIINSNSANQPGYVGGGATGGGYSSAFQGKQNAAGTNGGFGYGANQTTTNYRHCSACGGGGWYGGGGGERSDDDINYVKRSGGGSGFVNTAANAGNRPTGYTGLQLDSGTTYDGNTSFEAVNGGKEIGHSGDGYARITRLA